MFTNCSLIQLYFLLLSYFVDTIDPSEIFLDYFADICDAIEVKPLFTVNQLFSAKMISLNFKENIETMSGEVYEKANEVVNELQRQVHEKGIEFLKALCDFLLKQNQELKDIGTRMKIKLQSKRLYYITCALYIRKLKSVTLIVPLIS